MILAAGLGTRLRPLTSRGPKALVPVAGVPMLERTARRLVNAGVDRLIINLHSFPDEIRRFVESRDDFGVDVVFSDESDQPAPLETGGGLRRAAPLFRGDSAFYVHNVDVITDAPLERMLGEHGASGALATLAVNERAAARYLLFDDEGLCGRVSREGERDLVRAAGGEVRQLAFCGVHVAEPELLERLPREVSFPIARAYLGLAAGGERIRPFHIGDALWLDMGTAERLREAERALTTLGGPA